MSRVRFLAVVAAVMALATAAHGEDAVSRASTRDLLPRFAPLQLSALFFRGAEAVETADGVNTPGEATEVVVARVGTDGKPVMACVDNEAAALRFLAQPPRPVRARAEQDR